MASQITKLVTGESFLVDLGAVRFNWTIKDYKEILNFGKTIRSPNFEIETTDPSIIHHPDPAIVGFTDPATKVRSFRLEMEIPKKALKMQCPVYLVNEIGGEILTKVALQSYSPKWDTYVVVSMEADASQSTNDTSLRYDASSRHDTSTNVRSSRNYISTNDTSLRNGASSQSTNETSLRNDLSPRHDTSSNDRKKVLTVTLPDGWSFFPDDMSVEVKVGTKSRFSEN
jgi:hypothetical protein